MLVGMAAGGWLIIRALLLWVVSEPDYPFGIDIPVAAAVLGLWAGTTAQLLRPPRTVLASASRPLTSARTLVWSLGRRFRFWNVLAVPVCGVLAVLAAVIIPVTLGGSPGSVADLWLGLPVAIGLSAFAIAATWIVLRAALHGVELTPTHLIARGYFRTRQYPRHAIVSINAVDLEWWPSMLLAMLLNSDVQHTLQLSLDDGSEPLLLASNSHQSDVEFGAELIRAWRSAPG